MIASAVARAPPSQTSKPRDYLSFSAIRTYQSCPLRYWFRYVQGLPEKIVSASLVFGSAIHRAIQLHHQFLLEGNGPPDLDALVAAYREEWSERQGEGIKFSKDNDRASLDSLAVRMLVAFRQSDLAIPQGRILGVEEEVRGEIVPGIPELLARLDLITETPEELVISDWKTSRSRWSRDQVEDSAEQLLLYSRLVRDWAPGKRLRIEFAVLTKTKAVAIERHSLPANGVQVSRIVRVVERVWRAIEAQHFYPSPSPMACPSCPFRDPCRKWTG
jgi:putative RecB family exonuclease